MGPKKQRFGSYFCSVRSSHILRLSHYSQYCIGSFHTIVNSNPFFRKICIICSRSKNLKGKHVLLITEATPSFVSLTSADTSIYPIGSSAAKARYLVNTHTIQHGICTNQ